jgi:hypothetical protein
LREAKNKTKKKNIRNVNKSFKTTQTKQNTHLNINNKTCYINQAGKNKKKKKEKKERKKERKKNEPSGVWKTRERDQSRAP